MLCEYDVTLDLIVVFILIRYVFFLCYGDHRELHVLTHSFPTRRSADLSKVVADWTHLSCWDTPMILRETQEHVWPVRLMPDGSFAVRPLNANEERILRSEEHTSELQSLIRNSYAVFCLQNKN